MTGSESHVLRWEAPLTGAHPIIEELRSRPGQWAVIWEEGSSGQPIDDDDGAPEACICDCRIEAYGVRGCRDDRIVRVHARWIPEKPKPRLNPEPYSTAERRNIEWGTS